MSDNCDLIRTIDDDQEVPDYSEESEEEDDVRERIFFITLKKLINNKYILTSFTNWLLYCIYLLFKQSKFQPHKYKKEKTSKDFDSEFQFVNDAAEYNKDTWDDLSKYIKRKAKTKLDDKIKSARRKYTTEEASDDDEVKIEEDVDNNEICLSDEDLKKGI